MEAFYKVGYYRGVLAVVALTIDTMASPAEAVAAIRAQLARVKAWEKENGEQPLDID